MILKRLKTRALARAPKARFSYTILCCLSILLCSKVGAQIEFGPSTVPDSKSKVLVRELNSLNQGYLDKQRKAADEFVRFKLGRQLHQEHADLRVIQTAIDRGYLSNESKETLQAFGAAMGDIFVNAHANLNWKVYEDNLGASHAVCLDGTEHCIFPMTILSRLMNPKPFDSLNHLTVPFCFSDISNIPI